MVNTLKGIPDGRVLYNGRRLTKGRGLTVDGWTTRCLKMDDPALFTTLQ
jgi:hypothetical protein